MPDPERNRTSIVPSDRDSSTIGRSFLRQFEDVLRLIAGDDRHVDSSLRGPSVDGDWDVSASGSRARRGVPVEALARVVARRCSADQEGPVAGLQREQLAHARRSPARAAGGERRAAPRRAAAQARSATAGPSHVDRSRGVPQVVDRSRGAPAGRRVARRPARRRGATSSRPARARLVDHRAPASAAPRATSGRAARCRARRRTARRRATRRGHARDEVGARRRAPARARAPRS